MLSTRYILDPLNNFGYWKRGRKITTILVQSDTEIGNYVQEISQHPVKYSLNQSDTVNS